MVNGLIVVDVAAQAPAGALTWAAWSAMRDAEVVYVPVDLDPQWEAALESAWISLVRLPADSPAELAAELLSQARRRESVVWFGSLRDDPELARALTTAVLALAGRAPAFEVILGSWARPGSALLDLVSVMDRLRSPGGCPWDAEQTHASLVPYALEEAYEVAEAVEAGDRDDLIEELGDLLLQVVFHARLGQEWQQPFGLDEIADGITRKLRRRHPHVFGDVSATTAAQVEANWEQIKQAEKQRDSVFDGVPAGLPSLARATKLLARFDRAGLDASAVVRQLAGSEHTPHAEEAGHDTHPSRLGARMLALVAEARDLGVDPEAELRAAVRALERAGRALEASRPIS